MFCAVVKRIEGTGMANEADGLPARQLFEVDEVRVEYDIHI